MPIGSLGPLPPVPATPGPDPLSQLLQSAMGGYLQSQDPQWQAQQQHAQFQQAMEKAQLQNLPFTMQLERIKPVLEMWKVQHEAYNQQQGNLINQIKAAEESLQFLGPRDPAYATAIATIQHLNAQLGQGGPQLPPEISQWLTAGNMGQAMDSQTALAGVTAPTQVPSPGEPAQPPTPQGPGTGPAPTAPGTPTGTAPTVTAPPPGMSLYPQEFSQIMAAEGIDVNNVPAFKQPYVDKRFSQYESVKKASMDADKYYSGERNRIFSESKAAVSWEPINAQISRYNESARAAGQSTFSDPEIAAIRSDIANRFARGQIKDATGHLKALREQYIRSLHDHDFPNAQRIGKQINDFISDAAGAYPQARQQFAGYTAHPAEDAKYWPMTVEGQKIALENKSYALRVQEYRLGLDRFGFYKDEVQARKDLADETRKIRLENEQAHLPINQQIEKVTKELGDADAQLTALTNSVLAAEKGAVDPFTGRKVEGDKIDPRTQLGALYQKYELAARHAAALKLERDRLADLRRKDPSYMTR